MMKRIFRFPVSSRLRKRILVGLMAWWVLTLVAFTEANQQAVDGGLTLFSKAQASPLLAVFLVFLSLISAVAPFVAFRFHRMRNSIFFVVEDQLHYHRPSLLFGEKRALDIKFPSYMTQSLEIFPLFGPGRLGVFIRSAQGEIKVSLSDAIPVWVTPEPLNLGSTMDEWRAHPMMKALEEVTGRQARVQGDTA